MPSNIFFNGQRVYRPGVYLRVIDAITAPTSLSAGNIAVVGNFPVLEQAKMHTFSQPQSMLEYFFPQSSSGEVIEDQTLRDLQFIAQIAWDQLTAGIGGEIDSINLINITDTAAASYTDNGIKIESKFYGPVGNQLKVELDLDNGTGLSDLIVKKGTDVLERFDNIGDEDPATVRFDNNGTADLTDVTIEISASALTDTDGDGVVGSAEDYRSGGQVLVRGAFTAQNADIVALGSGIGTIYTPVSVNVGGGVVKVTNSAQLTAAHTVTVTGTAANGTALTEDLDLTSGQAAGTLVTGSEFFKTIEKVEIDLGASFAGDLEIDFPILTQDLEDINSIAGLLSALKGIDPRFAASDAPAIPVSGQELDRLSPASCLGADVTLDTRLYRIWERALNASQFLSTKLVSNVAPTGDFDEYLVGGAIVDDADSTDWEAALESFLYENINIVVPFSTDLAIHRLVKQHCKDAAIKSGLERNAWVGTPAGTSLQNAHLQYVKDLNDANMAIVTQGMRLKNPAGGTLTFNEPYWLALTMAVMQARTPIAEPLTRKRLSSNVHTMLNSAMPDPDGSADEAIRKGIVVLNGRTPYRVERSVTTYLKDPAHPVFTEVSANESINVSSRDVRAYLEQVIGSKATASALSTVQRLVQDRLAVQRDRGIIANFRSVAVELAGDRINVSYYVAAQEPLNFVLVNAYLTR